jgi:LTXXQ motif family protein
MSIKAVAPGLLFSRCFGAIGRAHHVKAENMDVSNSIITKLFAAGAIALAFAGPVAADDERRPWQGWGMGQTMPGWGWGSGPMMGFGPDARLDRIDGRLAFLKTELKITDAQSAAWDDLAVTIRTTAEAHNTVMRSMFEQLHDGDYFKMPLPERLGQHESNMESQLKQIKALRASVDTLYAVLEDDQKKVADEIVLPTMGMGGGFGIGPGMMFR